MSHVQDVATKIQNAIDELDKLRRQLPDTYNEMVRTAAEYDSAIAKAIASMASGVGVTLDNGVTIKKPAMAVIKEYAKGACTTEMITKGAAEYRYKSLLKNMEHAAAKLSAYQTLFRHLDVGP